MSVVLTDTDRAVLAEVKRRFGTPSDPFDGDAWRFCCEAVITKDEASGTLRKWPNEETYNGQPRYDYLRRLTQIRRTVPILAVEKSRRMLLTWLFLCVYLHDTVTCPNHANFVVSKKEEDAAYLLGRERMLGVYERIPRELWPDKPEVVPSGKAGMGYTLLACPSIGSYVQAVAQGADQLRQFTASNILLDEFAFQERQAEAWSAMKPTIDGGGHIDIISTPELGAYMYDLIYDIVERGK